MLETLQFYFQFPFVWYALIVGVLIALCASLLGVTLVLKRFSFIGDGLSHVAFGAMAVSGILGVTNQLYVVMPVTIICAVLLLKTGQNTKIKGDAAIAMISVGALAFGYLLLNKYSTSANLSGDVCSTLFGSFSILTLKRAEVVGCVVLSLIVVIFFVFFYHKIFQVTFDETFAKAVGTRVDLYNLLIAVIIAMIIVLAMNLVGSLLISALIIFPALSAMRLWKSYKGVTISSVIISVFCAATGILLSILQGTPVGSTIVAVNVGVFLICCLIKLLLGRKKVLQMMSIMGITLVICSCTTQDSKVRQVIDDQIAGETALKNEIVKETETIGMDGTAETDEVMGADGLAGTSETSELNESGVEDFSYDKIDLDMTQMSSTMVYSEVYNMMVTPEDYIGKIVKMDGSFAVYQNIETGQLYFACVIQDATACCAQGIEFELAGNYTFPDDYPAMDEEITVVGEFDTYEEDGYMFCRLKNADLYKAK